MNSNVSISAPVGYRNTIKKVSERYNVSYSGVIINGDFMKFKKYNICKFRRPLFIFYVIFITSSLFLGGCSHMPLQIGKDDKKTIESIAYDENSNEDYLVYIKEDNVFEPYLVITSDYDGNVLLLRKYLLAETMPFNENESQMWASYENGGYYEDSSIDKYLNTEFFNTFDQSVKDSIVNSTIVITDKSSLGVTGEISATISRKVFLLSLKELDGPESRASVSEGNTLKYFKDDYTRRIADLPNGGKSAYWTRTSATWETYTVITIGEGAGVGSADIDSGVRPAFCMKKDTRITQSDNVVSGQTVYVIE